MNADFVVSETSFGTPTAGCRQKILSVALDDANLRASVLTCNQLRILDALPVRPTNCLVPTKYCLCDVRALMIQLFSLPISNRFYSH